LTYKTIHIQDDSDTRGLTYKRIEMQEESSGRLRHKTREEKDGRRMKLCRQRYKRYEVVEAKIQEV